MKMGIIIYSADPETAWNALRIANCALMNGDKVEIFLLAKGVELESLDSPMFNIKELVMGVKNQGGKLMACSTCVQNRDMPEYCLCETSKGMECYQLIRDCDKVLTF